MGGGEQPDPGKAGSGWIVPQFWGTVLMHSFEALCPAADLSTQAFCETEIWILSTQSFVPTVACRGDMEKTAIFEGEK